MAGGQGVVKGKAGRRGAAGLLLPLFALAPLGYLIWPTLLLAGPLLAPTVAAAVVDRSRQRYLAFAVGLLNLACVLPSLLRLWTQGHDRAGALALLGDPETWLLAFLGGGLAWLIHLAMPPLVAAYYAVRSRERLATLHKRRQTLEKNWGEEVSGPAE
ncbi:MAG: hypothetical protein QNJ30_27690 [Kiloniellales bacterium]|nr:hypothetical protein [Kiloniellales bacterium]